ncbi:hypothetical protein [Agromyces sp. NBRC 114283]|uniref:hypothetical protein n=1 Tax=Agromyces sp. NBRC 114283 TaxID=2994521 RepID=UPI0024A3B912|nr:hypothetical protein [Agromyces sp. NBRC 114283]GLU88960.1 hypothetical protein Agsp01_12150 [Agromyces sp. NBRC 114283]
MAQTYSYPGPTGLTTTTDARKNFAGLIATSTGGVARAGIFPSHANALVTSRSDLNVNIAAFTGCAVQFGGPILLANDGTVQLPSPLVSPVSGTNYYVVYVKQNESASPGTDGNTNRILGTTLSTSSLTAARALLPTGALELATVEMPTGKTATNQSGVVITQTHQYTATQGAVVWLRNATEQGAWSPADGSVAFRLDTQTMMLRSGGSWGLVNTGLNLITASSFSAVSQVLLDGVFSSAFDNYLIEFDESAGSSHNLKAELRVGGSSRTASYWAQIFYGGGSSATAAAQNNVSSWQLTGAGGHLHALRLEIHKPADAGVRTSGFLDGTATDLGGPTLGRNATGLWFGTTEAHDGLRILPLSAGPTMTGTVRVYGYYSG